MAFLNLSINSFIKNIKIRNTRNIFLKYKKFLKLGARKFRFPKYKKVLFPEI